ncbi:PEPxxWA-CTERM sorting domain-containing protein [Phenylobacterium sp.]|uniref:PEPxxWA-CTERM sorting domain-containing protein n=1 Tax=Phenylobacterium sp. TaxID=1871053 RepID=UPI00356561F2
MKSNKLFVGAAAIAAAALAGAAQASVYDLKTDWSNASNPNGVWTYRQGVSALPFVASWRPSDLNGVVQPAWAQGNTSGAFLPGFFQAVAAGSAMCATCDWQVGDILDHTTDQANGGGEGIANVLFTSPSNGSADISGLVWNARSINRTQDWSLSINGTVVDSGVLLGDGTQGRLNPTVFNFSNVALAVGDQVVLSYIQDPRAPFGDLVGSNLDINLTPSGGVPEPATWAMMVVGFGGLGAVLRRRRGQVSLPA